MFLHVIRHHTDTTISRLHRTTYEQRGSHARVVPRMLIPCVPREHLRIRFMICFNQNQESRCPNGLLRGVIHFVTARGVGKLLYWLKTLKKQNSQNVKNAPTSIVSFTLLRARKNVEFQQINKVIRIRGKVPGSSWFGASRDINIDILRSHWSSPESVCLVTSLRQQQQHTHWCSKMNRNYPSLNLCAHRRRSIVHDAPSPFLATRSHVTHVLLLRARSNVVRVYVLLRAHMARHGTLVRACGRSLCFWSRYASFT